MCKGSLVLLMGLVWTSNARAALPMIDWKLVADNLPYTVAIVSPKDNSGRLFIVQQTGQIRIFNGTQVLAANFLDINSLIVFDSEQGLLGLAFSPGYATNGLFYVYYTRTGDGALTIARYSTSANPNIANTSGSVLLTIDHSSAGNHNGGNLVFGADGYLYTGTGDGGGSCDSTGNNAQNLGSLLGKLIRIDVSNVATTYTIPPSNPFVATNGARPEIWAYGLRNPWRFSFDRSNGDLFIGDVGQDEREEVDFQTAAAGGGQNYGWRVYEGTIFSTQSCPTVTVSNMAAVAPIFDYDHSGGRVAVVGGYRYRGAAISPLAGAYLYSDEKANSPLYCATQTVANAWVSGLLLTNTPFRITTFGEDQNGEIYFSNYANTSAGAVYQLVWKDTDGDGMPDDSETLAGTNPNDPASLLRVIATGPSNTDWSVTFNTIAGKSYALERNSLVVTGGWLTVSNNIPGTGGLVAVRDPGATTQSKRFYRVRLLP